mmetsp:Transcript_18622/g.71842  ORF Transcript_18622/g.71842 Transcript_18622/m.71842 type:complete len:206 (-) Transcript_18622:569-1186(-)
MYRGSAALKGEHGGGGGVLGKGVAAPRLARLCKGAEAAAAGPGVAAAEGRVTHQLLAGGDGLQHLHACARQRGDRAGGLQEEAVRHARRGHQLPPGLAPEDVGVLPRVVRRVCRLRRHCREALAEGLHAGGRRLGHQVHRLDGRHDQRASNYQRHRNHRSCRSCCRQGRARPEHHAPSCQGCTCPRCRHERDHNAGLHSIGHSEC